jgi:hypothetical protein
MVNKSTGIQIRDVLQPTRITKRKAIRAPEAINRSKKLAKIAEIGKISFGK